MKRRANPRTYRTAKAAEKRLAAIAGLYPSRNLCIAAAQCGPRPFNWAVFIESQQEPGRWAICA